MRKNIKDLMVPLLFLLLLAGCKASAQQDASPDGYDMNSGSRFLMPESLFEISGISFNKGNPDSIFAIQDEEGKFFSLKYGVKKQTNAKFGKKGDYEDVSVLGDKVYILKSTGVIYSFNFADRNLEDVDSVQEWMDLVPKGEYEGMFGDEATGKLYLICKNCKDDDSKNAVSGYILSAGDSVKPEGEFQVNVDDIKAISGKVKRGFRPSAIAKNPVNGYWYIVSSVNKLLIVADANWKIKESIELNGNTFTQPEGIAFDKDGNMYISNEGDDLSQGNIIKFTRKAK